MAATMDDIETSTMSTASLETENVSSNNDKGSIDVDEEEDATGFKMPVLPVTSKKLKPTTSHEPAVTERTPDCPSSLNDQKQHYHEDRTHDPDEDKTTQLTLPAKDDFALPTLPKPKSNSATKHLKKDLKLPGEGGSAVSEQTRPKEKSPAEKLSKAPALPYKEPSWGGIPSDDYYLEVLKNGDIVSKIELDNKSYHVFGRLETCDVPLEHPSLSRYHLVLQYRGVGDSEHDPGFYLYDLGSMHGSWFNKQRIEGRVYYRIRVGHMFKLGGSTRLYILQGPSEDQEAESELSVTELKELRKQQLAVLEEQKQRKQGKDETIQQDEEEKDSGISWGMDYEDADEADGMGDNPFAIMTLEEREASYAKDPKKALKGYFDREGYDLEYNVEEKESAFSKQFICRVELPIDDASGRPIYAEAAVSGKKKEAVAACALEACRILDAHGVLRQATHESRKRKAKNWKEDDYYDSDEDTFLDRTGEIEKKRLQRMKKAGVIKEKAQTYDSLKSKLSNVESEIQKLEAEMAAGIKGGASSIVEDDSLDAFMESIKTGKTVDKTWRAKLKLRLIELNKDQVRLTRLADIARPPSMPELKRPQSSFAALSKKLPMVGSMKGRHGLKPKLLKTVPSPKIVLHKDDVVEEDDDDEMPPATSDNGPPISAKPAVMDRLSPCMESTSSAVVDKKTCPAEESMALHSPKTCTVGPSIPIEISGLTDKEQETVGDSKALDASRKSQDIESRSMPQNKKEEHDGGYKEIKDTGIDKEVMRQQGVTTEGWVPPRKAKRKAKGPLMETRMDEGEDTGDYAAWMPPSDQTGDGRTRLNAKFGY